MAKKYDAFLSHSSADKDAVEELARWLEDEAELKVWLDKWHLVPGDPWQKELERALDDSKCCVVFVGPGGIAGWHHEEMRAALEDRVRGELRVLPVLLPGANRPDGIPTFLRLLGWVEFREGLSERESRRLLVSGIRGEAPGRPEHEGLGSELEVAVERLEELTAAGEDTAEATEEVLRIKRSIRHGAQPRPSDVLGLHHKLIEPVGQGGFGTVWRALDRRTRTVVAVKVLHGQWSESAERKERFFRGARQMAKLDHPSIVRVLSPQEYDYPFHYFVMEYLDGGDLNGAVLGGLLPEVAVGAVLCVGAALQHAHDRGVIHRDVKPANILLSGSGAVRLTDFDLVQAGDTTGGTRTGALGSFVYAAPEAMDDAKSVTVAADIYSLGMVTLFSLVGRRLTTRDMFNPERALAEASCGESTKDVVRRAIAHDSEQRWSSVQEFSESLGLNFGPSAHASVFHTSAWPSTAAQHPAVHTPAWATAAGRDEYGEWAQIEVQDVTHRLRRIEPGRFLMGSPETEVGRFGDEGPQHEVTLTRGFWLGEMPCTQELWEAVMGENPSKFRGPRRPVEHVSWVDCQKFLERINEMVRGVELRLPTEAEWECACRAGTTEATYDDERSLSALAWFDENSGGESHPVGEKLANPWGLHDMLGNVLEWCSDSWRNYARDAQLDPRRPAGGSYRVFRGGSWDHDARDVRSAYRGARDPSRRSNVLGFRLARGQEE